MKQNRLGFNDGAGMINHGIGLLHEPKLNESLAFTGMERNPAVGTCAICGRPLSQDGRCLRCLADLGFLSGSQEPGRSETPRRLTPGPLKYDHFEVEVGADGFAIELGSGAIATTYRARDTVLNSLVALKVIDRKVAQMPGVRSRFLREARAAAQIHHPNVRAGQSLRRTRWRMFLRHGIGRRRNARGQSAARTSDAARAGA
jgi:hypothetical protein